MSWKRFDFSSPILGQLPFEILGNNFWDIIGRCQVLAEDKLVRARVANLCSVLNNVTDRLFVKTVGVVGPVFLPTLQL